MENEFQTRSTVSQMKSAAVGAAALSAVISGSINTVKYISLAREGKITPQEAIIKIAGETAASAADSAVKASGVVGAQSLLVRYGSEKAAVEILAKQSLKSLAKANAVTIGVVCTIDAIKDRYSEYFSWRCRRQSWCRVGCWRCHRVGFCGWINCNNSGVNRWRVGRGLNCGDGYAACN